MHQEEQMDEEEHMHKRKILLEGGTLQPRGDWMNISTRIVFDNIILSLRNQKALSVNPL